MHPKTMGRPIFASGQAAAAEWQTNQRRLSKQLRSSPFLPEIQNVFGNINVKLKSEHMLITAVNVSIHDNLWLLGTIN
jgi:hypothetical protein